MTKEEELKNILLINKWLNYILVGQIVFIIVSVYIIITFKLYK